MLNVLNQIFVFYGESIFTYYKMSPKEKENRGKINTRQYLMMKKLLTFIGTQNKITYFQHVNHPKKIYRSCHFCVTGHILTHPNVLILTNISWPISFWTFYKNCIISSIIQERVYKFVLNSWRKHIVRHYTSFLFPFLLHNLSISYTLFVY